ncbi:unnamed protein product, partial [Adineta steineri]
MVGFDAKNKSNLDSKYKCSDCSLILRDPVQLSACGHRLCHSCFLNQNQTLITCSECQIQTPSDQILIDRAFSNEMQTLSITCSYCDWSNTLQNYEKHLQQLHSNPICQYCSQQFNSIDQFNQHKSSQCQNIPVECLLKKFGCHLQIVRSELSNHYRSEQHQHSIANILQQMKSQLKDSVMTSNRMNTDGDYALNQLEELEKTMNMFRSGGEILEEDVKQHSSELAEHENKLRNLTENISQIKLSIEEETALLEGMKQNLDILNQDLVSLEEKINDMQCISYDGTFVWKIRHVQEIMMDAKSERQPSIYSPPSYSSAVGYKMRARLYPNGDGNARKTHMSLFFVLMRGPNDAILKFPFNYKVTFCLHDQTPQQRHIIDSFRPDIKSNSFQRPRSEMNIASGIPKFVSLGMIQQEGNPYVRDDTMFIKIVVDFGDMPKTLLPFTLSLNPGLPIN